MIAYLEEIDTAHAFPIPVCLRDWVLFILLLGLKYCEGKP